MITRDKIAVYLFRFYGGATTYHCCEDMALREILNMTIESKELWTRKLAAGAGLAVVAGRGSRAVIP